MFLLLLVCCNSYIIIALRGKFCKLGYTHDKRPVSVLSCKKFAWIRANPLVGSALYKYSPVLVLL